MAQRYKRYVLLSIIVVSLPLGCKKKADGTTIQVNVEAISDKDIKMELYYLLEGQNQFNEKNKKTNGIEGGLAPQSIKFEIPRGAIGHRFRIDFGDRKMDAPNIFLRSVTVEDGSSKTTISQREIGYFFYFNEYVRFNKYNGELTFLTLEDRSDPFMISRPILQKKIKIDL